jgi:hypothetical protein
VIVEILFLALASTVRPTSLAAVYALVSHQAGARLLVAYVVAGLAFTIAFGLLIVALTHGIDVRSGEAKAIVDIAAGAIALIFGFGIRSGRNTGNRNGDAPKTDNRLKTLLDQRLTIPTAALAGPLTHIPGLFYLLALNVIIAHQGAVADKAFALLLYNAIWFALPIAALVTCVFDPAKARKVVAAVTQWTRDHVRQVMIVASLGVGTALVVRGLLTL